MSEFKGTPGKWVVYKNDILTEKNICGNVICISPKESNLNASAAYWQANAKLIAKAPEMLEILTELKEYHLGYGINEKIRNLLNEIL